MGSIAAELEKAGIPTVATINERHTTRFMANVLPKGGFADYPFIAFPEAQLMTEGGAKKSAEQAVSTVVAGLTTWKPPFLKKDGKLWKPAQEELTFSGATYQEALEKFNQSFLQDMYWGDGLPLLPPTREKVDALLKGSPVPADTVIGKWGPATANYTAEKIAINAAMAGARPEYMPVIIAAMQAILSQKYDAYSSVMKSAVPLVVVNGPVAAQIGLNSSSDAFGPNPKYPAGATIGRAIMLSMRNIGGPGKGLLPSNLAGSPAAYAGMVVAEAEDLEALLKGWEPLNVQLGMAPGTNAVTVLGVDQMDMSLTGSYPNAAAYVAPDKNAWPSTKAAFEKRTAGVVVMSSMALVVDGITKGVTKADIQKAMYEKARIPQDEFKRVVLTDEDGKATEPAGFVKELLASLKPGEPVPVAASPKNFLVIASGGH